LFGNQTTILLKIVELGKELRVVVVVVVPPLRKRSGLCLERPVFDLSSFLAMASSLPIAQSVPASSLPLRNIPGDYGVPLFGAIKDRLDYFWFQGEEKFYQSRVEKYNSTVFRTNMPPGPPLAKDARVICVLDQKSFPILFDTDKCEKKNVFLGTYMPSLDYTNGYRVLSYLDPSEERHTKLKQWCFDLVKRNGRNFLPDFHAEIEKSMEVWESALANGGKANLSEEVQVFAINFLLRAIVHHDPEGTSLGRNAGAWSSAWSNPQLLPIAGATGLPHPVEEVLHTIALPFSSVKQQYDAIFDFIKTYATDELREAAALGIERNDAITNLMFFISFNAYGGFNIFFPQLAGYIAQCGPELMHELHAEVAAAVAATDGKVTPKSLANMPLLQSVVYEGFRFRPPVPYQYAKAKTDFVIESHVSSFQVSL
jgi:hydroperoxide dehydratase